MAKNVTMRDIAKKVGVSTVTVSKALTDKDGVGSELRAVIKATAEEMGYTYSGIGDGFRRGRSYNIGVIVEEHYVDNSTTVFPFYMKMYNSINKQMSQFHYSVIMEAITSKMLAEHRMPDIVAERKVDGVIVLGQMKSDYLKVLRENKLPVVYLDFYDRTMEVPSVINDNMYGTYMLTNYLVSMGHKKIAYVGTVGMTNSITDRYLGYLKSMMEHGMDVPKDYVMDDRDTKTGRMDLEKYYKFPKDMPTAFVCNCDLAASYLIRKLENEGYRIPEDVSVVGFDNFLYPGLCDIGITTYEVDISEMARRAIHKIVRKIANENYTAGVFIVDGHVVFKDSVARI